MQAKIPMNLTQMMSERYNKSTDADASTTRAEATASAQIMKGEFLWTTEVRQKW